MIREAFAVVRLNGQAQLLCLLCEQFTAHHEHVTQRYCPYCAVFLDEVPEAWRRPPRHARLNPGWKTWPPWRSWSEPEPEDAPDSA